MFTHSINDYRFCPFCSAPIFTNGPDADKAIEHLMTCQRNRVEKTHPEVEQLSLDEGIEDEEQLGG